MKFGELRELKITAVNGKKRFRFHLRFSASPQPVEFETTADGAMSILRGLQEVQAFHKLAIPHEPASRGKPKLSIVRDDDE